MVALLTSREETAELLKMKQSVATPPFALTVSSILPLPLLPLIPADKSLVLFLIICLTGSRYVDLIIPRGSNDFVQYVMRNTDIPVPAPVRQAPVRRGTPGARLAQ